MPFNHRFSAVKAACRTEKNSNVLFRFLLYPPHFQTCHFYNKKGHHCVQRDNCNRLHVCRHFLLGKCKFPQCIMSHNLLDAHASRVLEAAGIDGSTASNFQAICDYKHLEFNRQPKKGYGELQETVVINKILGLIEVEAVLALPPS